MNSSESPQRSLITLAQKFNPKKKTKKTKFKTKIPNPPVLSKTLKSRPQSIQNSMSYDQEEVVFSKIRSKNSKLKLCYIASPSILYEGVISKRNTMEGVGYLIQKDNFEFFGEFFNGQRYGYGDLKSQYLKASGKFSYDDMNGVGKIMKIDTKEKYQGEFSKGILSGYCEYENHEKKTFLKGDFRGGRLQGFCEIMQNGELYLGDYWDSKRDGLGIYLNKQIEFVGGFKYDRFSGIGKLSRHNFDFLGDFRGGNFNGKGVLTDHEKKLSYVGSFREGLKSGFGRLEDELGVYYGYFRGDIKDGFGFYKGYANDKKIEYVGEWREDLPNGLGVMTSKKKVFKGKFINGQKSGEFIVHRKKDGNSGSLITYDKDKKVSEKQVSESNLEILNRKFKGFKQKTIFKEYKPKVAFIQKDTKERYKSSLTKITLEKLKFIEKQNKLDFSINKINDHIESSGDKHQKNIRELYKRSKKLDEFDKAKREIVNSSVINKIERMEQKAEEIGFGTVGGKYKSMSLRARNLANSKEGKLLFENNEKFQPNSRSKSPFLRGKNKPRDYYYDRKHFSVEKKNLSRYEDFSVNKFEGMKKRHGHIGDNYDGQSEIKLFGFNDVEFLNKDIYTKYGERYRVPKEYGRRDRSKSKSRIKKKYRSRSRYDKRIKEKKRKKRAEEEVKNSHLNMHYMRTPLVDKEKLDWLALQSKDREREKIDDWDEEDLRFQEIMDEKGRRRREDMMDRINRRTGEGDGFLQATKDMFDNIRFIEEVKNKLGEAVGNQKINYLPDSDERHEIYNRNLIGQLFGTGNAGNGGNDDDDDLERYRRKREEDEEEKRRRVEEEKFWRAFNELEKLIIHGARRLKAGKNYKDRPLQIKNNQFIGLKNLFIDIANNLYFMSKSSKRVNIPLGIEIGIMLGVIDPRKAKAIRGDLDMGYITVDPLNITNEMIITWYVKNKSKLKY